MIPGSLKKARFAADYSGTAIAVAASDPSVLAACKDRGSFFVSDRHTSQRAHEKEEPLDHHRRALATCSWSSAGEQWPHSSGRFGFAAPFSVFCFDLLSLWRKRACEVPAAGGRRGPLLPFLITAGCSSNDERLVDLSRQSLDRQAEQNRLVEANNRQSHRRFPKARQSQAQARRRQQPNCSRKCNPERSRKSANSETPLNRAAGRSPASETAIRSSPNRFKRPSACWSPSCRWPWPCICCGVCFTGPTRRPWQTSWSRNC